MEKSTKYQVLGHYIVADPEVCHGKPTFRGTRIMVSQVLQMVAEGMDWDIIIEQCHNSITRDAIAEAVSTNGDERRRNHSFISPFLASSSRLFPLFP
jgi:uncharacterized protein (DUF433 family)